MPLRAMIDHITSRAMRLSVRGKISGITEINVGGNGARDQCSGKSAGAPLGERPAETAAAFLALFLKRGYRLNQGRPFGRVLRGGIDGKERGARFGQIVVEVGD